MARGKFIVLDGGEGAGKTTVLAQVKDMFRSPTLLTREPGGTAFAEEIRTLTNSDTYKHLSPESFFALIWAARADHVLSVIEPTLKQGTNVIVDRFDSSTYAYQLCGQEATHLEKLFWMMRDAFLKKTVPDLYILLDVDPGIGLARARQRPGARTHFDSRELSFHRRVRDGFKSFLSQVPHKVIDAGKPLEEVKEAFLEITQRVIL